MRRSYPTDLSDEQWDLISPLLPQAKPGGRPRTVDLREILNAIFYILCAGCTWRMLPHDLPPWQTVYHYFRAWRKTGGWPQINDQLREWIRVTEDRELTPSAAVLDS